MNFVVTGATGFVGRPVVARLLERGDTVSVIGRDAGAIRAAFGTDVQPLIWSEPDKWKTVVQTSDAVIHLAGEQINGQRWTPKFKEKIVTSRVETTRAIAACAPKVLISASAVGFYGDRGDRVVTESDSAGDDFLASVCVAWEAEAVAARSQGSRVAVVRIGIVLGKNGGPLQSMLQPPTVPFSPFKMGLGGALGAAGSGCRGFICRIWFRS